MARHEWPAVEGVPPRPASPPCPWPVQADLDGALRILAVVRIVGRWKR